MPASGLIALIDDVAAIADDVATLTVSAAKKSTGLVTDDMAVTAEQTLGFAREREIPVVLRVGRGSMINKTLILAPAALALNAVAPWAIHPILFCGGLFLAYEGVHKIHHTFAHHDDEHHDDHESGPKLKSKKIDLVEFENKRVAGAIRTDLILSAEIVALTLKEVATERFVIQASVVYSVAILITLGVFGIVAMLVKIDDFGEWLAKRGGIQESLGLFIVKAAPVLLKIIAWVGTVAMLMVGGHILMEGIHPWYEWVHHITHGIANPVAAYFAGAGFDILTGAAFGTVLVLIGMTGLPQKAWAAMPWVKDEEPQAGH